MSNAGAPPPAGLPIHSLRPGVTLSWGQLPSAPDPVVAFVFALSEPAEMRCESLLATSAPATSATPHVAIALNSEALRELLAGDESDGASRIRILAIDPSAPALTLPLSPTARLAVESIRRCPFVGTLRAMALTARGNDLLVEFLTGLANAANPRQPPLTRSMSEQIHAAAEILERQLENPPTLAALARSVGLGETTLKRGFHHVFGTTVFGYLRARRMERARALLESGEATVLEAAALVGYSNPSNFTAAFRREFGLNPKAFQLTVRRQ